jgi:hypothetical protein
MRLSPTEYAQVCGTGLSWRCPSSSAAIRWSNANAFHPFEGPPAVRPGRHVQQRAEGAVDECRRLLEGELPHVAGPQIEVDAGRGGPLARLVQHRRREVDADHPTPGGLRHRDGDPPAADRELDQRTVGHVGQPDVERDIRRHVGRPLVVTVSEGVGPGHRPTLGPASPATGTTSPLVLAATGVTMNVIRRSKRRCRIAS